MRAPRFPRPFPVLARARRPRLPSLPHAASAPPAQVKDGGSCAAGPDTCASKHLQYPDDAGAASRLHQIPGLAACGAAGKCLLPLGALCAAPALRGEASGCATGACAVPAYNISQGPTCLQVAGPPGLSPSYMLCKGARAGRPLPADV